MANNLVVNSGTIFNSTQQYLFGRAYNLLIGVSNANPFSDGSGPLDVFANGKPFAGTALQYGNTGPSPCPLRITFDIDKRFADVSNKAKFEIYNLSRNTRDKIKRGTMVQFFGGYNPKPGGNSSLTQQLFLGNVIPNNGVYSKRTGPDIITTMECGDGESSISFATFDKSYTAGTTLVQILQDLANAMGLTGLNAGLAVGIPMIVFQKGWVAHGSVAESLTKLLKGQNMEWSVHNGSLYVLPLKGTIQQTAVVVSKDTGMIGVPSNADGFTQFTSLLNPSIFPGSVVFLDSLDLNFTGYYKIRRAHYTGDSHENKWQVDCEGIRLPNVQQVFPSSQGFSYTSAVTA